MSMAQRIVLGVGILVALLVVLFPPWLYIYSEPGRHETDPKILGGGSSSRGAEHQERDAGYHFLLTQPPLSGRGCAWCTLR